LHAHNEIHQPCIALEPHPIHVAPEDGTGPEALVVDTGLVDNDQVLSPDGENAKTIQAKGRVAPGGYPPGAPTPYVRDYRSRLLELRLRCMRNEGVHNPWQGQLQALKQAIKVVPD